MFSSDDKELINKFHIKSGHSPSSIRSYQSAFRKYVNFHHMSLTDLLEESIFEQEHHVPENKLSVYDRIISFRNYLVGRHVLNTVENYVSKIKTFYRYNRVYLPFIPPLNGKSLLKNDVIGFDDLLTKDELRSALDYAGDDLKLWIMVLLSSGSSRMEAKSMTNQTFFDGTREYHKRDNFEDALKYLSRKRNVVCTCRVIRQKTDKPYYTFLNPECVQKIAKVKLDQEDFNLDNPILKYSLSHVNNKFKIVNDVLGFGQAGGFSRFRPHMIRKFHATYLNQGHWAKPISIWQASIRFMEGEARQGNPISRTIPNS